MENEIINVDNKLSTVSKKKLSINKKSNNKDNNTLTLNLKIVLGLIRIIG